MFSNKVYCLKCQSFQCSPYCYNSFIKESDSNINHENNQIISMKDSDSDSEFIPRHDSDETISDDNDDNDDDDSFSDEDNVYNYNKLIHLNNFNKRDKKEQDQ